jgi:ABC-type sugar transport system permease subunit
VRASPTWRKSRARRPVRFDLALGALTLPAIVLILAFSVLPVLYVAYLSLWDLRFGAPLPGEFAGWGNYRFILGDASVMTALRNTAYFAALSVAIATGIGLGIALLLDSESPGARWLVASAVLPWAIPDVVNALMWQWIYNPTYGALNGLLTSLRVIETYRAWLSAPWPAMHAVVVAYSWKLVPFVVIILYAALRSVPPEVYESAQIDGAGAWARFRHVSLPLIAPAVAVAVLFCVVWSMRAFDIVYLLTRGGPGEATVVLSYFTFAKAFEFGDLGAGAAVACVLGAATLAITLVYWWLLPAGHEG